MTDRNLDLVAAHDASDEAMPPFRSVLDAQFRRGDAGFARNVEDMVREIRSMLGSRGRLRRLRIFGHGSPGMQNIGHLEHSRHDVTGTFTLDIRDTRCVIAGYIDHDDTIRVTNNPPLGSLRSRFARGGWVELHGCRVRDGVLGDALLKALARLWGVRVLAGTRLQYAGDRFEGAVRVGNPDSTVDSR